MALSKAVNGDPNSAAPSRARRDVRPSVVQHHVVEPAWSTYRRYRSNGKRSWGLAPGLQSIFHCHHPTMWTFLTGIKQESFTSTGCDRCCSSTKEAMQCRICLTRNCETYYLNKSLNLLIWLTLLQWNTCMKCRGIKPRGIICRWD